MTALRRAAYQSGMFRGLSIKAVVIGVVVDWGLSFLVGLIVGVGLIVYLVAVLHGSPTDPADLDRLMNGDGACIGVCFVGSMASIVAGCVTGWIARSNRIKNALAAGLLSAASSAAMVPFMHGYPVWYFPACFVLTVAACTLGGVIAHGIFGVFASEAHSN